MNSLLKTIFVLIFIYCLFSFKVNLIGEIRFDDMLVALLLLAFLTMENKREFIQKSTPAHYLVVFVVLSLFSTFYNAISDRIEIIQGILFSIRHFEYLVFIFLGYALAHYQVQLAPIFRVYLLYVILLIILQSNGLVDPVSGFSADRAIANTGGPWELAAVSAFLVFFFLEKKDWFYFTLALVVLILTESRVTTLAVFVVLAFIFMRHKKVAFVFVSVFLSTTLSAVMLSSSMLDKNIASDNQEYISVFDRVQQVFSRDSISSISELVNNARLVETQSEYYLLTYGDGLNEILQQDGDGSALVRFARWSILIPSTLDNIDSSLIGLGPSFAGKAVDGNYVRLFIETGFIGLVIYLVFLISLVYFFRGSFVINYVIVLSSTAVFIDVFTTYKAMMLLWVYIGIQVYPQCFDRCLGSIKKGRIPAMSSNDNKLSIASEK